MFIKFKLDVITGFNVRVLIAINSFFANDSVLIITLNVLLNA